MAWPEGRTYDQRIDIHSGVSSRLPLPPDEIQDALAARSQSFLPVEIQTGYRRSGRLRRAWCPSVVAAWAWVRASSTVMLYPR